MTYEDARDVVAISLRDDYIDNLSWLPIVVREKCLDALEKQIPKAPTYEADGYADGELVYDTWYCPNCGKDYEVSYDDYDYCPCCGQRIDRSEVDE